MIIGGLDVGTTGAKITLYNTESGENIATYYKEYDVRRQGGESELNFEDIKAGIFGILKSATAEHRVEALGVTSFGETFAMLDENDNILAPSMLYTDPRGEAERDELVQKLGEEYLMLTTGNKPHPMFSIFKLMWIKKNRPELFAKCKRVLLGEDFAVYVLTGVAQLQYSLAARTGAFNIDKMEWEMPIFEAAGINPELFSKPVPLGTPAGDIRPELKKELGIDYTLTVVSSAHDQVAATIGSGVFECGEAMDGCGTVECIPIVLKEKPRDMSVYEGGYSIVPFIEGKYVCYVLSFAGGATLKWFRDNFAEYERYECEKNGENVYALLDGSVPSEPTGILVMPHFSGAATPYMDSYSKAAFVGLTFENTKYDIYKALMEGTSYEMLYNLKTIEAFSGKVEEVKATGGGASSPVWLQIKADIFNIPVESLNCKEVGATGAAALAGVAVGAFKDLRSAVAKMVTPKKRYMPNPEMNQKYMEYYEKYKNLYKAIKSL